MRPPAVTRADDAPAPARARGAARAALPRAQDPGQRALPSLTVASPVEELRAAVEAVAAELRQRRRARRRSSARSKAGFGDYSTNAAMLLAPSLKAAAAGDRRAARRGAAGAARRARRARSRSPGPGSSTSSSPTPGTSRPPRTCSRPATTGAAATAAERERVLIEFVSANPTGPLTAASGRHGAYGDALARLLEFAGHEVAREYYFNDAGAQVLQARRVDPRARPRRGAARGRLPGPLRGRAGRPDRGRRRARPRGPRVRGRAADDRAHPGDDGALPRRTSTSGSPSAACTTARSTARWSGSRPRASSYRSEGALWLRTTDFGDEPGPGDRAVQRDPDLLRGRHRLPREQARARLRPADPAARRRPPRLHRAA